MTTTAEITAKAAYEKGWASAAKNPVEASNRFLAKYGTLAHMAWVAGNTDKAEGQPKWSRFDLERGHTVGLADDAEAAGEQAEAEDAPEAPVSATDGESPEQAEIPAEADAQAPAPSRPESIKELQARIDTKTMEREEIKDIRERVASRKKHYQWGWNSQGSNLFAGDLEKAKAGYLKRHGMSDLVHDWLDGWEDREAGNRDFGQDRWNKR